MSQIKLLLDIIADVRHLGDSLEAYAEALTAYGASKTGRWAGRNIQLQNLPQNHITDLTEARETVKWGYYDEVEMLYDDVPDTLSQLIRTAFIPRPGMKFIVADFSAIEARVIGTKFIASSMI